MAAMNRKIQMVFAIAIILVLGYLVGQLSDVSRPYSPNNTGPMGTRAFYLLLSELGYTIESKEPPYIEVVVADGPILGRTITDGLVMGRSVSTNDEQGEVLFIVGNEALRLLDTSIDNVLKWVKNGNTLFLFVEYPMDRGMALFHELGLRIGISVKDGITFVPVDEESPYGEGVINMAVGGNSSISIEGDMFSDVATHIEVNNKPVCISGALGDGQIFIVSDTSLITNSNISLADNVIFFTNIIDSVSPPRVIFSDPIIPSTPVEDSISREGPGILFYTQLLLIAGFLIYSLGKRLGPVIGDDYDKQNAMGNMEYMEAMARLLRRGKAHKKVLELIYDDFVERHGGKDYFEVTKAYNKAMETTKISKGKLIKIIQMMNEYKEERDD